MENTEEISVHKDVDASASDILPKLFELGYEEIIQNIFLHLDPKSLKNCKTTCQMWREFIDRRIWGSLSSKKHLQKILATNWKHGNPTVQTIRLPDPRVYTLDKIVSDGKVFVCVSEGEFELNAFRADTLEHIYSFKTSNLWRVSVGGDFLCLADPYKIYFHEKLTGKEIQSFPCDAPVDMAVILNVLYVA